MLGIDLTVQSSCTFPIHTKQRAGKHLVCACQAPAHDVMLYPPLLIPYTKANNDIYTLTSKLLKKLTQYSPTHPEADQRDLLDAWLSASPSSFVPPSAQ